MTEGYYVQKAHGELTVIDTKMSKLDQLRVELAEFFCEDAKTFRLDDCVKTFHEFFEKFQKATQVSIIDTSQFCMKSGDELQFYWCGVRQWEQIQLIICYSIPLDLLFSQQ